MYKNLKIWSHNSAFSVTVIIQLTNRSVKCRVWKFGQRTKDCFNAGINFCDICGDGACSCNKYIVHMYASTCEMISKLSHIKEGPKTCQCIISLTTEKWSFFLTNSHRNDSYMEIDASYCMYMFSVHELSCTCQAASELSCCQNFSCFIYKCLNLI